jgi:hypothetical protein
MVSTGARVREPDDDAMDERVRAIGERARAEGRARPIEPVVRRIMSPPEAPPPPPWKEPRRCAWEECGEEFMPEHHQQIYCQPEHSRMARAKQQRDWARSQKAPSSSEDLEVAEQLASRYVDLLFDAAGGDTSAEVRLYALERLDAIVRAAVQK